MKFKRILTLLILTVIFQVNYVEACVAPTIQGAEGIFMNEESPDSYAKYELVDINTSIKSAGYIVEWSGGLDARAAEDNWIRFETDGYIGPRYRNYTMTATLHYTRTDGSIWRTDTFSKTILLTNRVDPTDGRTSSENVETDEIEIKFRGTPEIPVQDILAIRRMSGEVLWKKKRDSEPFDYSQLTEGHYIMKYNHNGKEKTKQIFISDE